LQTILLNLEQPTATPTLVVIITPTPQVTSTPDTRAAEQIFAEIQQAVTAKQWDQVIQNVMAIREVNYDYQKVLVDGYYYIALRNRGIQKSNPASLNKGCSIFRLLSNLVRWMAKRMESVRGHSFTLAVQATGMLIGNGQSIFLPRSKMPILI